MGVEQKASANIAGKFTDNFFFFDPLNSTADNNYTNGEELTVLTTLVVSCHISPLT